MRRIVLGICVLAAACGGKGLDSPTSPTSAASSAAQTHAQGGTVLPFSGSYTFTTAATFNCPPTCPPTIFVSTGALTGTATHLGQFTGTSVDNVDIAAATSTGTLRLTAANGDQLFATTAGGEDQFVPPNVSHVTLVATISGGTGRFADATGTFTIRFIQTIDFVAATSNGPGSFEGQISLNK